MVTSLSHTEGEKGRSNCAIDIRYSGGHKRISAALVELYCYKSFLLNPLSTSSLSKERKQKWFISCSCPPNFRLCQLKVLVSRKVLETRDTNYSSRGTSREALLLLLSQA